MSNENKSTNSAPESSAQAPVSRAEVYALGQTLGQQLRAQAANETFAGLVAALPFPVTVHRLNGEGDACLARWHPAGALRVYGGADTTERGCVLMVGMHLLRDAVPLPPGPGPDYLTDPEGFATHSAAEAEGNAQLAQLAGWFVAGWYGEALPASTPDAGSTEENP